MPACNALITGQKFTVIVVLPASCAMLIVITPPTCVSQEHSIVRTLFDQGLQRLHIRKPGWSEEAIEQYVDRVASHRDRIVIHSTPQLAARLGVKVMCSVWFEVSCLSIARHEPCRATMREPAAAAGCCVRLSKKQLS